MSSKSVAERLASHFGTRPFGLEEAYKAVPDVPTDSVRGRIYEAMKKNIFSRLGRGMYAAVQAYRDGGVPLEKIRISSVLPDFRPVLATNRPFFQGTFA